MFAFVAGMLAYIQQRTPKVVEETFNHYAKVKLQNTSFFVFMRN